MFSLQCLCLRKIDDANLIPSYLNYDYNLCCININFECAIRYGHLECLKYAHINGNLIQRSKKDDFCAIASCYGNLNCLKYLHEEMVN